MTENRKTVWLLGARGMAAVVFGAVTPAWPQVTVVALALVFGAYALADGALLMATAWRHRRARRPAAACAGAGVLSVVAAAATALWPDPTALTLVVMAGAWAITTGCLKLWAATRMRHERHARLWRISAAASVAAGVLLWLRPDTGAPAIALILSLYALVVGGIRPAAAWREYRTHADHPSSSPRRPASGARLAH
ncbi:HdeD family acid-resistance protein [Streptomyces sp. PBH53]|uniref:HdeD family acid-resistance protein n=1 Tax=Streptomyces sp. PBH53 TaxID=1577075 RepID=UPI000A8B37F1|nr:DUF308 domain-containing protein [Streptomyces sp. PBH53]